MGLLSDLSHDLQQSFAAGAGGIGDFLLDVGAGASDLFQKSDLWQDDPIENVSWPAAAAVAVIGSVYVLAMKK